MKSWILIQWLACAMAYTAVYKEPIQFQKTTRKIIKNEVNSFSRKNRVMDRDGQRFRNSKSSYGSNYYLDIMCGMGESTMNFYKNIREWDNSDFELIGLDPNPIHIQIAREKYPFLYFEWGFLNSVRYDPHFFQMIQIDGDFLIHYSKPRELIRELHRILKPSGFFQFYMDESINEIPNSLIQEMHMYFDLEENDQGRQFIFSKK